MLLVLVILVALVLVAMVGDAARVIVASHPRCEANTVGCARQVCQLARRLTPLNNSAWSRFEGAIGDGVDELRNIVNQQQFQRYSSIRPNCPA